jgi:hypothetical protein
MPFISHLIGRLQGIVTKNCGTSLDHCVQLTGWGVDQGVNYWSVRNSWATSYAVLVWLHWILAFNTLWCFMHSFCLLWSQMGRAGLHPSGDGQGHVRHCARGHHLPRCITVLSLPCFTGSTLCLSSVGLSNRLNRTILHATNTSHMRRLHTQSHENELHDQRGLPVAGVAAE